MPCDEELSTYLFFSHLPIKYIAKHPKLSGLKQQPLYLANNSVGSQFALGFAG